MKRISCKAVSSSLLACLVMLEANSVAAASVRPVSEEIKLSSQPRSDPWGAHFASIIHNTEQGLGILWMTLTDEGKRIWGRFFDAELNPTGDTFAVETQTDPSNDDLEISDPVAAITDEGNLIVAWDRDSGDFPFLDDVRTVRIDGQSGSYGEETDANVFTYGIQQHCRVIGGPGDRSLILWQHQPFADLSEISIHFRQYLAGVPVDEPVSVSTASVPHAMDGAVVSNEGRAIVFWSGSWNRQSWQIYGTHVGEDGAIDPKALVTRYGRNGFPAAAALPDGNIILSWRADGPEKPPGIYSQIFDSELNPISEENLVWADPRLLENRDRRPHIAASPSGRYFVVVWVLGNTHANEHEMDAMAQLLDSNGRAVGAPFYVSETLRGDRHTPEVAFLSESTFALVWMFVPDPQQSRSWVVGRIFEIDEATAQCGDANEDGALTAGDALKSLRAAVGTGFCDACVCDVDGSGTTSAADALAILRAGVGGPLLANCPSCDQSHRSTRLSASREPHRLPWRQRVLRESGAP